MFGEMSYTAVSQTVKRVRARIEEDKKYRKTMERLNSRLKA